jgi:beta-glucosidase-like glycosyl hydrolase
VNRTGRLLFPALRWRADSGFGHEREQIETALEIGVGGFSIFGGPAPAVAELTAMLRARSAAPLLIGSDVERGAGQQFPEATQLPPLAAIGWLDDLTITHRAGALTAREALAVGVNWLYAPVADVDLEPRNPIVGSRAFGADAERVAAHVAAWIGGAREAGAICCAKHFPGHGRTVDDSHTALPRVTASRDELEADLRPFRAAITVGVDSLMTAHVAYDALDPRTAATLSSLVISGLLRHDLEYDGLVVTDALNMEGVLRAADGGEPRAAIAALNAGCDGLLYPSDLGAVAAALERALGDEVTAERAGQALRRVDAAAQRAGSTGTGEYGTMQDRVWADAIAERALVVARGAPRVGKSIELLTIDDDLGGPFSPPLRDAFEHTLRAAGVDVHARRHPAGDRDVVVALYSDIRAWKPRPGLSPGALRAARDAVAADPDASVVFFGHPRLTDEVPGRHLLAAWGGEAIMQRAAASWLARTR